MTNPNQKLSGIGITGVLLADADGGGTHDVTNDIMDFASTTVIVSDDVTGLDKNYHERLPGLQDQTYTLTAGMNPTNDHLHKLCSRGLSVARALVLPLAPTQGGTITGVTQSTTVLISTYGLTRDAAGKIQSKVSLKTQSGIVTYS